MRADSTKLAIRISRVSLTEKGFGPPHAAGFQPVRYGACGLSPFLSLHFRMLLRVSEDCWRISAPHQSKNTVWRFHSQSFPWGQAATCCG
jgi:hypothetical protein